MITSEVYKIFTPSANIESWLADAYGERCLFVEMEEPETRALAGVRLDKTAAVVLLGQLQALCQEAGWIESKE